MHELDNPVFARLRARLESYSRRRARANAPRPPPQVLIDAPGLRFEHGDLGRRFHCASVDKVMIAVLAGRLVEQGRLSFDAPLGQVLPGAEVAELPAADGVDIARDVTVEHPLSHTSGLPDWFDPPRGQEVGVSMSQVVQEPDRRWSRTDILDLARTMRAVGRPGERFEYSDTAYLLLTRILEEASGMDYVPLLESEVFEPSGMGRTSSPFDDDFTVSRLEELDMAPMWLGRHEVSRKACLSVGWGGVVTTAADLVSFQRVLHSGGLVRPETLGRITRPRRRMRVGIYYGAGTVTLRFGEYLPLLFRGLPEPIGGLGVSASHMFFYPALQAHVILNFHATRAMNASFQVHLQIARALQMSLPRSQSGELR